MNDILFNPANKKLLLKIGGIIGGSLAVFVLALGISILLPILALQYAPYILAVVYMSYVTGNMKHIYDAIQKLLPRILEIALNLFAKVFTMGVPYGERLTERALDTAPVLLKNVQDKANEYGATSQVVQTGYKALDANASSYLTAFANRTMLPGFNGLASKVLSTFSGATPKP